MLYRVRPRDLAGKTMRGLAFDLVAEVRQLDRRIAKAVGDIEAAVVESGSSLTELCGIGVLKCGQDPRPGRLDSPVPLGCRVRKLYVSPHSVAADCPVIRNRPFLNPTSSPMVTNSLRR